MVFGHYSNRPRFKQQIFGRFKVISLSSNSPLQDHGLLLRVLRRLTILLLRVALEAVRRLEAAVGLVDIELLQDYL
jgi:hypothetical protein